VCASEQKNVTGVSICTKLGAAHVIKSPRLLNSGARLVLFETIRIHNMLFNVVAPSLGLLRSFRSKLKRPIISQQLQRKLVSTELNTTTEVIKVQNPSSKLIALLFEIFELFIFNRDIPLLPALDHGGTFFLQNALELWKLPLGLTAAYRMH
jgi:hypothetical protein